MKRTLKYVGLDVHQASTVACVREEGGRIIARSVVRTEERALLEFIAGMRGSVHIALEEGTQAQWLYELLKPRVDRVVVCDRRGEKKQGNKADDQDAERLADDLRCGRVRAVYHDDVQRVALKELARTYENLVEDTTRTMLRLKALFRARAIATQGMAVYQAEHRAEWLAKLPDEAVRFRARILLAQLDMLRELRLATMRTPWRFRTKRNLWAYAGLAVVTHSSADYAIQGGRAVRRHRKPMTRGLNKNHNRILKNVFKSAATAATARPGPLQDLYQGKINRGMRDELARVTLTRKMAALTLRLWKKGELYDPTRLTKQAQ